MAAAGQRSQFNDLGGCMTMIYLYRQPETGGHRSTR